MLKVDLKKLKQLNAIYKQLDNIKNNFKRGELGFPDYIRQQLDKAMLQVQITREMIYFRFREEYD